MNKTLTLAVLMAAAGATRAEEVTTTFVAPVFKLGNHAIENDQVVRNTDGSFTMLGTDGGVTSGWQLDWNINVDYDPFINGSLSLTNFGPGPHSYVLVLDLPVSAFGPSSLYGGSLTATVFDDNGDSFASLTRSSAGDASPGIYQGTIDDLPVLDLFGSMSCSGGPHCSSMLTDDRGLPGPTIAGPAVNGHIGTVLRFDLSAGDRVVFNTNFTVTAAPAPVPLPSSAWMVLAALGCFSYFTLRRRTSSVIHSSLALTAATFAVP